MLLASSPAGRDAVTTSGRPPGSWSDRLWSAMAGPYAAVLGHPFLTGLVDGTLPPEAFTRDLTQDAHYLRDYARALALLAGRADPTPHQQEPAEREALTSARYEWMFWDAALRGEGWPV